jgi:hypothetical protein
VEIIRGKKCNVKESFTDLMGDSASVQTCSTCSPYVCPDKFLFSNKQVDNYFRKNVGTSMFRSSEDVKRYFTGKSVLVYGFHYDEQNWSGMDGPPWNYSKETMDNLPEKAYFIRYLEFNENKARWE